MLNRGFIMANSFGSIPIPVLIAASGGILSALILSFAGGPFAILGGLLALIGTAMAVVIWKFGYVILPLITQRTNVVVMDNEGHEIPPSQDVIVKKLRENTTHLHFWELGFLNQLLKNPNLKIWYIHSFSSVQFLI